MSRLGVSKLSGMVQAVDWCSDGSVYVVDLALACCALESQAALARKPAMPITDLPADAKVVLTVSGTLTGAMAPAISATIDTLPQRPVIVAFGACACAGGPYWDSYAVINGVSNIGEVDHVIAGCPPSPDAFTEVIEEVRRG